METRVVLPEPLGPKMAQRSPRRTVQCRPRFSVPLGVCVVQFPRTLLGPYFISQPFISMSGSAVDVDGWTVWCWGLGLLDWLLVDDVRTRPTSARVCVGIVLSSTRLPDLTPWMYFFSPSRTTSLGPMEPIWQSVRRYIRCVIHSGRGSCGLAVRMRRGEAFSARDWRRGLRPVTVGGSRPIKGSSRSKTSGCVRSARAMRARLPWPLLRKVTGRFRR